MNENIDLTKILENCPTGTKLYTPVWGEVTFIRLNENKNYPIKIYINTFKSGTSLTKDGHYLINNTNTECILFPSKEQRDWSKFTAPWYKKEIEHKFNVGQYITDGYVSGQITSIEDNYNCYEILDFIGGTNKFIPFTLQDNYHLWNIKDANDGDVIHFGAVTAIFKKYIGREKCICYCSFCKDGGFEIPIENGDDNVYGGYNATPATKEQCDVLMKAMNDAGYEWDIEKKELKKLVLNRFDPKTLKPFDKVLIRRGSESYNVWFPDFVSEPPNDFIDKTLCMCIRDDISIVIPYNNETKHLVGTTEEAPEYYRYWED